MAEQHENGHTTDGIAETYEGPPPSSEAGGGSPSQSDILGLLNPHNQGSPLELLVKMPQKIEEWGLRTVLSAEDVGNINEIIAQDEALEAGHMDVKTFLWRKAVLTISIDGRGRREYLQALEAATHREKSLMQRAFGNGLTPGPEEKGGPR